MWRLCVDFFSYPELRRRLRRAGVTAPTDIYIYCERNLSVIWQMPVISGSGSREILNGDGTAYRAPIERQRCRLYTHPSRKIHHIHRVCLTGRGAYHHVSCETLGYRRHLLDRTEDIGLVCQVHRPRIAQDEHLCGGGGGGGAVLGAERWPRRCWRREHGWRR